MPLNLQLPIIQAPLAGGADTPELVAAVYNAGALGFIGAAYLTPEQIAASAAAVRQRTSRSFGINLFSPDAQNTAEQISGELNAARAIAAIATYHTELGLPAPLPPSLSGAKFDEQLAAALETSAAYFSFTFGLLPKSAVEAIKSRAMLLIGTATTVDEALALEKSGVDAIVAQGAEAGGHRGTFTDFDSGMIGSIALVPQVVDAVRVPVIASGGIMDGRGIVAALALGANAVQMGTAFLTCDESGIPDAYKQALLAAHEDHTRVTRAFSGRPARGIVNRFMREVESGEDGTILPFPFQNSLTRPLRNAATKQDRAEFLNLWSGQGVRMARRQSAKELIARLVAEMDQTFAALEEKHHAQSQARTKAQSK
jgi:nitronate monooxygenase